ncbi:MAG: flavoprotein, partial [Gammaproteobacteria bacterium]
MLEVLGGLPDYEIHLVMSSAAKLNIGIETDQSLPDLERLADVVHNNKDIAASISSGSFKTDGMIIAPCSMRTLSGIVNSYADNLLLRAADVVLK